MQRTETSRSVTSLTKESLPGLPAGSGGWHRLIPTLQPGPIPIGRKQARCGCPSSRTPDPGILLLACLALAQSLVTLPPRGHFYSS